MDLTSNQAVTPTSTLELTPVKRRKQGDVREDGKVFWSFQPGCINGEWWITPAHYATKKAEEEKRKADQRAKRDAAHARGVRLHLGGIREDGRVFFGHHPRCRNGEWWVTPEAAKTRQERNDAIARKKKADEAAGIQFRCGDTREDGRVFWKYKLSCEEGQNWISPEVFERRRKRASERKRERISADFLYALKHRLRNRIGEALKTKRFRKNSKTTNILGCSYEAFRLRVEAQFLPGMTWANFSTWHIDHIVPCAAATNQEDLEALFHYTNLRPLWGSDNRIKHAKLPDEDELPADLLPKVREIYLTAKARSA